MRTDEEFARRLQRLGWDCRRGMMETEVMLAPFCERVFPSLLRVQQEAFLDLVDCSDADLFTWFTSDARPDDPALAAIVDHVLAARAAR